MDSNKEGFSKSLESMQESDLKGHRHLRDYLVNGSSWALTVTKVPNEVRLVDHNNHYLILRADGTWVFEL